MPKVKYTLPLASLYDCLAKASTNIFLSVECVEVDASRTKDNVLVAVHVRDIQRILNNSSAEVEHFSSQEVTQIDLGKRKVRFNCIGTVATTPSC